MAATHKRDILLTYSKHAKSSNTTHTASGIYVLTPHNETTRELSKSAVELITAIHHSTEECCTWRCIKSIAAHIVHSVAIAVQRGTGLALNSEGE